MQSSKLFTSHHKQCKQPTTLFRCGMLIHNKQNTQKKVVDYRIVFPAAFHVVGWIRALLQCLIMRNYSSISDKKYHIDALRQHAARVSTSKAWPQHWKKQVLTVTSTTDFPLCPTENPKS